MLRGRRAHAFDDEIQVPDHGRERIVYLVRNSRGQGTHRRHPIAHHELCLQLSAFGDIPDHTQIPDVFTVCVEHRRGDDIDRDLTSVLVAQRRVEGILRPGSPAKDRLGHQRRLRGAHDREHAHPDDVARLVAEHLREAPVHEDHAFLDVELDDAVRRRLHDLAVLFFAGAQGLLSLGEQDRRLATGLDDRVDLTGEERLDRLFGFHQPSRKTPRVWPSVNAHLLPKVCRT